MINKINTLNPFKYISYSRGKLILCDSKPHKKVRNSIKMLACMAEGGKRSIPLSLFTRNQNGDVVLYRGINGFENSAKVSGTKSVAALNGWNIKSIFDFFNLKRNNHNLKKMATASSLMSVVNDAFIHTTTKKNLARKYAKGGLLFEYHIPVNYLKKYGIVGCYQSENEINFLHSLPDKFLAKVESVSPRAKIQPKDNPFSDMKYCFLPKFEDRNIVNPLYFMGQRVNPYYKY